MLEHSNKRNYAIHHMQSKVTIKNFHREKRLFQRRVIIAAAIIVALSLTLLFRLAELQLIEHTHYVNLSRQNQSDLLPIEPNRGLIYDRNGVLLAENIPVSSLDIIPNKVKNLHETIAALQKIITITPDNIAQFHKAMKQHHRSDHIPLKMKLNEAEIAKLYVNLYRFPGVMIDARMIRNYPLGPVAADVVGYVGRISEADLQTVNQANYSDSNFIGKTGIERYYESSLHGTVGYRQVEVDATGRIVRNIKNIPPTPGTDIYLTIDSKLQATAQKALGNTCGSVVAIDPKSGEILALVSNPSYDPNIFVKGVSDKDYAALQNSPHNRLYNRAIRGEFPIASTIKPFIAIEGLNSETISPSYRIYDRGWFKLPNADQIYFDWNHRHGGHGYVNVTKAIIVSSDPFFYNLAVLLGIDRIDDILTRFGFGNPTGIDLPGELSGLVPTPNWKFRVKGHPWYTGDTVISGIGQGFMLATPLQLAAATTTLASHGIRYRPHLLFKAKTPDGKMLQQPPIVETPIKLENGNEWNIVTHAMQGVIKSINPQGTGRKHFGTNPGYTVAGKTGTAQVYRSHDRDEEADTQTNIPEKLRNHSLFIAFAPVKNPKIAIAVIAEHSPIAGTVARKVLDCYLLNKQNHKHAAKPDSRHKAT